MTTPPGARNLRLLLEYDGGAFHGWQRQQGLRSVQGDLEAAVKVMTGEEVFVRGAGRTDAGVHAMGQVANFRTDARIPTGGFLRGLNANLQPDVAVLEVTEVPEAFDARLAARGKHYRYQVWNHLVRSPLARGRSWHCRSPLDLAAMRAAAALLEGEHDFAAFRASDCERRTTRRLLRRLEVSRQGALVTIDVEGTAFLKHMVRIISGTLVAVGRAELTVADVAGLLEHGDRTQGGMTAPAAGLTLVSVTY
jgi:tRNA pseudouridine38-40 synthase